MSNASHISPALQQHFAAQGQLPPSHSGAEDQARAQYANEQFALSQVRLARHLASLTAQHMIAGQPGSAAQRTQSPHPGQALNGLGVGRPPSYATAVAGYPGSPTLQSRRGFPVGAEGQMAAEGAQFARIPSAQPQAGSSRFRPPNTPSTAHESPRVPHAQAQLPPSQPSSANQDGSLAQQQHAAMLAQQQAQAQRMAEHQTQARLQQQHQQSLMAPQQRRMAVAPGAGPSPKIGPAQASMQPQPVMPPQQAQMARAPQRIVCAVTSSIALISQPHCQRRRDSDP